MTGYILRRLPELMRTLGCTGAEDANSSAAKVGAIKFQRRVEDDDDDWDI